MGVFLVTGIKFGWETTKSEKPDIKLKGKFIIAAFVSFIIGAILDALLLPNLLMIIINRAILISGSIEYYLGFILPDKIKKLLLRDN
jgi:Na+/citrate or Na+/malate symporter